MVILVVVLASAACSKSQTRTYASPLEYDVFDVSRDEQAQDAARFDFLFAAAVPGPDETASFIVGGKDSTFTAWRDERKLLSNPDLEPLMAELRGEEWLVEHVGAGHWFRVPVIVQLPAEDGSYANEVSKSANNHWRVHASGLLAVRSPGWFGVGRDAQCEPALGEETLRARGADRCRLGVLTER